MYRRFLALSLLLAAFLLLPLVSQAQTTRFVSLAATGERAPGCGLFHGFYAAPPEIDVNGVVTFAADVTGSPLSIGLFACDASGQSALLAKSEKPLGEFARFLTPATAPHTRNASGQQAVVLPAHDREPGGLYVQEPGRFKAIARSGELAPDGGIFRAFASPVINTGGTVVFAATLTDDVASLALFRQTPDGQTERLIAVGDTLFGGTVAALGTQVGLNERGQVAFLYRLTGGRSGIGLATTTGPMPTVLSPITATAGGPAFTLTVSGSGFDAGCKVHWNGKKLTTAFVSANKLTAKVTASEIAAAGTINVIVVNVRGVASNSLPFTVIAPTPALTGLAPDTAVMGSPTLKMTLTGSGFVKNSKALWNGSLLTTKFMSATTLTATVTAKRLAVAGTPSVTVTTPDGGTSAALPFTITSGAGLTLQVEKSVRASVGGVSTIALFIAISNKGTVADKNVSITQVTFNSAATSSTLPLALGTINMNDTQFLLLLFPGTAAAHGVSVPLVVSGKYDGGTFALKKKITAP